MSEEIVKVCKVHGGLAIDKVNKTKRYKGFICKQCIKQREARYRKKPGARDKHNERARMYNAKNPCKRKARAKRYLSKIINNLTDSYINNLIIRDLTILSREEIPKALTEAKRIQLQIKREALKLKKVKYGN